MCPKVPPLRIKAIKSDESVENAKTSDSVDTKYEIHDDSNEAQQNGEKFSPIIVIESAELKFIK